MKKLIYLVSILTLTSCSRGCSSVSRDFESGDRNYKIQMFSGGKVIFEDNLKTIVNNNDKSDGCYYYNSKGELVELSGDYILISND